MDVAVIGSGDAVLGFSLAGIRKAYDATSEDELVSKINEVMADPDVGILVLNQSDFNKLPKRMQSTLTDSVKPTVISIGTEESTEMREKIKRAIGVDLWK
ncbi:MAG: V-type ATP synthase subunit F [Methanotrichaceae archaeon]|jgi:V/A-type H+-transporting ATPase subunit F